MDYVLLNQIRQKIQNSVKNTQLVFKMGADMKSGYNSQFKKKCLNGFIKHHQQILQGFNNLVNQIQKQLNSYKQKIQQLRKDSQYYKDQLYSLKKQNNSEAQNLKSLNSSLQSKITKLQSQIQTNKQSSINLKEQLIKTQKNKKFVQQQNNNLKSQITKLKKQNQLFKEQIKKLNDGMEKYTQSSKRASTQKMPDKKFSMTDSSNSRQTDKSQDHGLDEEKWIFDFKKPEQQKSTKNFYQKPSQKDFKKKPQYKENKQFEQISQKSQKTYKSKEQPKKQSIEGDIFFSDYNKSRQMILNNSKTSVEKISENNFWDIVTVNKNLSFGSKSQFKFQILELQNAMIIGICELKKATQRSFQQKIISNRTANGFFGIKSDGMYYCQKWEDFENACGCTFKAGDQIQLKFDPKSCYLSFIINRKNDKKLHEFGLKMPVSPNTYSPFVMIRGKGKVNIKI